MNPRWPACLSETREYDWHFYALADFTDDRVFHSGDSLRTDRWQPNVYIEHAHFPDWE